MTLEELIVKRSAYTQFSADARGRIGHAYLLVCEDGVARERLLNMMTKLVFCPTMCNRCDVCRSIEEGNFPDVTYLDGKVAKVSDINEMVDTASLQPVVSEKKVFVINNFDSVGPLGQNKLLKTYEEPPEYLTLIFAARSENGILTTIKSRAKKLYFDAFSSAEIIDYLVDNGVSSEDANIAAALGGGSVERAEKITGSESFAYIYEECFAMLYRLKSSVSVPEEALSDIFSKDNIPTTLDVLETIFSDIMKHATGENFSFLNEGRSYDVKTLSRDFSPTSASLAISAITDGRKLLSSNVSSISAAERVLFNILEAKHKWH